MSYLDQIKPKNMLSAMGIGTHEPASYFADNMLPALAIFTAGVIVGATVAVLVTPKSGPELRSDISRKASELSGTVRNRLPETFGLHDDDGKRTYAQQQQQTRPTDV